MPRRELDYQKDLCDIVIDNGGFARKIAHRFIVGVPDLLVVMPERPAWLLEAKLNDLPAKPLPHTRVTVSVTIQQLRFLRQSHKAGMTANGVVSFLHRGGEFAVAVKNVSEWGDEVMPWPLADYVRSTVKARHEAIFQALIAYDALHGRD